MHQGRLRCCLYQAAFQVCERLVVGVRIDHCCTMGYCTQMPGYVLDRGARVGSRTKMTSNIQREAVDQGADLYDQR